MTPSDIASTRRIIGSALALAVLLLACVEREPLVLQPLAPGVLPTHRTSQGRPPPGVRPLIVRARWVVADGVHRGLVGSQQGARVLEHHPQPTTHQARDTAPQRVEREDTATPSPQRVDVNSAPVAALDTLPGVGPAIADRIVRARPFRTLDDLLRVRGIGAATLERIRPHAVVRTDQR